MVRGKIVQAGLKGELLQKFNQRTGRGFLEAQIVRQALWEYLKDEQVGV